MAYPALLVGLRIGAPVLSGALALAGWDLFLDPQMVAAGHWRFTGGGPRINAIPLSNTLGWSLVALVIMSRAAAAATTHRAPGGRPGADSRSTSGRTPPSCSPRRRSSTSPGRRLPAASPWASR